MPTAAPKAALCSWLPSEPPPPVEVDGTVVATLLTGVFGLFPVSLTLGFLWLYRNRHRGGRRARKLVRTGVSAAVVWALLGLVVLGVTQREQVPDYVNPSTLTVGDCFNAVSETSESVGTVPREPCTRAHNAEVVAIITDADFGVVNPTDDQLDAAVRQRCLPDLNQYVLDPWGLPSGTRLGYYYDSLFAALRPLVCFVVLDSPVNHSVRTDSTTLTASQYEFLVSMREVYDLRVRVHDADGTAWELRRNAASDLAAALTREDKLFSADDWPSAARPALARLAAAQDRTVELWRQAGDATQEDDFNRLAAKAAGNMPDALLVNARTALGLTTTPARAETTT
jgi:hypothetical protein